MAHDFGPPVRHVLIRDLTPQPDCPRCPGPPHSHWYPVAPQQPAPESRPPGVIMRALIRLWGGPQPWPGGAQQGNGRRPVNGYGPHRVPERE